MTEYKFIYKCRRCGQFDDSASVDGRDTAQRAITNAVIEVDDGLISPGLLYFHQCKDGGIGVSDLQGASPVVEMKNPKPQIGERGQSIGHCCGNGCFDCTKWSQERPQTKGGKTV